MKLWSEKEQFFIDDYMAPALGVIAVVIAFAAIAIAWLNCWI